MHKCEKPEESIKQKEICRQKKRKTNQNLKHLQCMSYELKLVFSAPINMVEFNIDFQCLPGIYFLEKYHNLLEWLIAFV